MPRCTALVLLVLGAAVPLAPGVAAHVGPEVGFSLGDADRVLTELLSVFAVLAVVLTGFGALRRRARRGDRPDASWALVVFGVAWVVASVTKAPGWTDQGWWRLTAAVLVFGTIASAWWVVWPRVRAVRASAPPARGALAVGVLGEDALGQRHGARAGCWRHDG